MDEEEAMARQKALKYVMGILQRPEQLEKVTQYQRRIARKKASGDALVKTALQSQLDGVHKGFELLKSAQADVEKVKVCLEGFDKNFQSLPKFDEIREENRRHSQLVTVKTNLNHIYAVPEMVNKTKDWIAEGKLLFAAKSLAELENSRDDLQFELFKQGSESDRVLLSMYYQEVDELSELMLKQIRLILGRTLNTVRKDPTVIVTALRVIDQEEARDAEALQRYKQTGFESHKRPKKWKEEAMEVLQSVVASRVEGTQTDEREGNKMWLVKHLELTRILLSEDMRVIKTLCTPCFPPSWQIESSFTRMYQSCLQTHVEDLISTGLEGNEIVTLLSWVLNTYPELDLPKPLLPCQKQAELQASYLNHVKTNLSSWMERTIAKEREDWKKSVPPEQDGGVFMSSLPSILSQMVEQTFEVARTVSAELTSQVNQLCCHELIRYSQMYAIAVRELRDRHFADRSRNDVYTQQMIAVLNNCVALHHRVASWSKDGRSHSSFLKLRDTAIHYLLQEPFSDLKPQFDAIFSQPSIDGPNAHSYTETIVATFVDYFNDYTMLSKDNQFAVLCAAREKVGKAYVYKIIEGNIKLNTDEERRTAVEKIRSQFEQIRQLFQRFSNNLPEDADFELVKPLTEVIYSDKEMLHLDLIQLVNKFPEITHEQLSSVLLTRGDMSKAEVLEAASSALSKRAEMNKTLLEKGMFSLRGKATLNLDWDHYWNCIISPP